MFTVYVLYSPAHDKIYIGFSSNLLERLKSHNQLGQKGWTIKFRPWIVVHEEAYAEKGDAMKREKQLKTFSGRQWTREQVLKG